MNGKSKKLRIVVAGCGRIAWLGYLPWINKNPGAEIIAVADADKELAERTAKKFNAGASYTDWEQMLESCRADAFINLMPPWLHAEPVVRAAELGMHVLCEKPMATSVEECRRMITACEKSGVRLQIGHSYRFDPGYEKLKIMVGRGDIGDVFQLKSVFDLWVPDLNRTPMRELIEIGGRLRLFSSKDMGAWRVNDVRSGGGAFMDHGIHYIDLFSWILEEKVTHVCGTRRFVVPGRELEDHASGVFKFESGISAYIEASLARLSAFGDIDEGMLHGSGGCMKYSLDQSWYIRGFPHLNNTHARLWKYGAGGFPTGMWLPVLVPHGRHLMMFKRQMDFFISKLNGAGRAHRVFGDDWAASGMDGLNALRCVIALYKSDDTNTMIPVLDD